MIKESWDKLPHAAKELSLFADDHGQLNDVKYQISNTLRKKMSKGKYSADEGAKAWKYHADMAARKYTQAYGGINDKWHEMFPDAIRKKVASHNESKHREQLKESIDYLEEMITASLDKKPVVMENSFNKLMINKITTLVNEKREEVKKSVFNKKDNVVHASLSGE